MFVLVVVFAVLGILAVVSLLIGHGPAARTRQTCQSMHRQCAQFVALAEQDSNPLVQLMHATSAVAYADALSALVSEENSKSVLGLSLNELGEKARAVQKKAVTGIQSKAPALRIATKPLAMSAGWDS